MAGEGSQRGDLGAGELRTGIVSPSRGVLDDALAWLGTTSPFNITAEATTLGSFTEAEVGELLAQHTALTEQRFSAEAVTLPWEERLTTRQVEHRGKRVHIVGAEGSRAVSRRGQSQCSRTDVPHPAAQTTAGSNSAS